MKDTIYRKIEVLGGVQPSTDETAFCTSHFTHTYHVRFRNGFPEKLKGWISTVFDYGAEIAGVARSITSDWINGKLYTLIGTNSKLYSLIGSTLTNISPFQTVSIAVANSLDTHYDTLVNDPVLTVNGLDYLFFADAAADDLQPGDEVTISGAVGAVGGIPDTEINGTHLVRTIVPSSGFSVRVTTIASSDDAGGGAAVVRTSGLLTVNDAAHGQSDGARVSITGAANTGGILAAEINQEFIIRNVAVNSFDVMTTGTATSSVAAGGGAATAYYQEIGEGPVNESAAQGYGAGLYGAGLYGTALVSSLARAYPRVWFFDRYADTFIMTPGNQGAVYQWDGNTQTAPSIITNAPTTINYAFVSDNILVTFGAGAVENKIFASDQNDIEMWVSSSTNQVFEDNVEGAGRLISHVPVENYNLIFTEFKTYKFRYIGLPLVWEILPIDEEIGLIAPMARVSVNGVAYWMGQENFYMYRGGGIVEIIPSNNPNVPQCTALEYVFDNLNYGQKSKIFAWYNKEFNEIWFHYPQASSNEPDRVIRVCLADYSWSIDEFNRTCAEYPNMKLKNPRLIDTDVLYNHEYGWNADGAAMPWSVTSNKRFGEKKYINLNGIIPDSVQVGTIQFDAVGYAYPQSTAQRSNESRNVTATQERIPYTNTGRFWQYTWSGEEIDQEWSLGCWIEEIQEGATAP